MPATSRVPDTDADAAVARGRPMPAEKKMKSSYPPCPHCGSTRLVYHCSDKVQCTWLKCANCLSIIDPDDWSHLYQHLTDGHPRITMRRCTSGT